MNSFSNLGLSSSILEVLEQMGFENPTPVQSQAIPLLLQNDPTDFIGLAQTGTGKTAAFGLPLIDLIDPAIAATQAIILAPTRELGQQTAKQLNEFSKNQKAINIEVVYGGASITSQIDALRKTVQIIVATPGRLIDLIKRRSVKLDKVRYVVLDEADEMLNMGFQEAIDEILEYTNNDRVIWLFSATMPPEIRKIVKNYMQTPLEVSINREEKSNKDISHKYVITKTGNKLPAIRRIMDLQPEMRGIMFCRTKRETQEIADQLGSMGYGVEALHGDLSQAQRDAVMKRFKMRSMQLLIATDVAARGIDVNDLTHVIHHTLPDQLESYTHRSGRTGRAGKKGVSLAFINPREGRRISELEKKINVTFERIEVPSLEELKASRINHWADLIVNTRVDLLADHLVDSVYEKFAHLSKEDILKRLITTQLDHLMVPEGEESDLNETHGGSPERRNKEGFNRYFVNLGTIDGMSKGDLLHLLSDISGISRKYFGDISLQRNCAYFDVDASQDTQLSERFDGVEIAGRDIRVNRDEQGQSGPRKGKASDFMRKKGKSSSFGKKPADGVRNRGHRRW